jgi:hypothetical protein
LAATADLASDARLADAASLGCSSAHAGAADTLPYTFLALAGTALGLYTGPARRQRSPTRSVACTKSDDCGAERNAIR